MLLLRQLSYAIRTQLKAAIYCLYIAIHILPPFCSWTGSFWHKSAGGTNSSDQTSSLRKEDWLRVCGGSYSADTRTSCLTLTDEVWQTTTTLREQRSDQIRYFDYLRFLRKKLSVIVITRAGHSSWAAPSGTILLGGSFSPRTSEKILEDGTSTYSFDLEYDSV